MSTEQSFEQRAQLSNGNIFLSFSMDDDRKAAEAGYVFLGCGTDSQGGEVHVFQMCDLATASNGGPAVEADQLQARGLKRVNKYISLYWDQTHDTWSTAVSHTAEEAKYSEAYQNFAGSAVVSAIVPLHADASSPEPAMYPGQPQPTAYERFERQARKHYGCTTEEEVRRVARHLYARFLAGGATLGKVDGKLVFDKPETVKPKLPA